MLYTTNFLKRLNSSKSVPYMQLHTVTTRVSTPGKNQQVTCGDTRFYRGTCKGKYGIILSMCFYVVMLHSLP